MKYHTLIFFRKLGKMSQNLSSAAVVIGALSVNANNKNADQTAYPHILISAFVIHCLENVIVKR